MDNLKILEDFYEGFEYFLEVIVLLEKCGRWLISLSNFDSLETLKRFSQKDFFEYNDVSEASEVIDEFKILNKMVITVVKKMRDLIKLLVSPILI